MRLRLAAFILVKFHFSEVVAAAPFEPDEAARLSAEANELRKSAPTIKPPPSLKDLPKQYSLDIWERTNFERSSDRNMFDQSVQLAINQNLIRAMLATATDSDRQRDDRSGDQDFGLITQRENRFFVDKYFADRSFVQRIHTLPQMRQGDWAAMRRELSSDKQQPGYFAGRPLGDYCAAGTGIGIPRNAAAHISVLDMAMVEATQSTLELSLLHLLDQPDAFASDLATASDEDEKVARPWQTVLRRWAKTQEKKPPPREFGSWWRVTQAAGSARQQEFADRIGDAAEALQKKCEDLRGRWQDSPTNTNPQHRPLFSCFSAPTGIGFELFSEDDPEFEDATALIFQARSGPFTAELRLDDLDSTFAFELKVKRDQASATAVLFFDRLGRPRARLSPQGAHYVWDENGHVAWSGRQDTKGIWSEDTSWSQSGFPLAAIRFEPNGEVKRLVEWYEGGTPARRLEFIRGRPDGLERWWHPSGIPAGEINWYGGKKFGSAKIFFENGQLAFDGSYVDDQLDGFLIWRDELGRSLFNARFTLGNADGPLIIKNSENVVLASGYFDKGRVEGNVIIGISGKRGGARLPFKSGRLDGEATFFDSSGTRKMAISYRSGKLHGGLKGFYTEGVVASACEFDDGHLLSWKVNPSASHQAVFQIEGRVLDKQSGEAELTVLNTSTNTRALCTSQKEIWTDCKWTLGNRSFTLDLTSIRDLRPKPPRAKSKCGYRVTEWNIDTWIEQNEPIAYVEVLPSKGCADTEFVVCRVSLTPNLPIGPCDVVADEHFHAHD